MKKIFFSLIALLSGITLVSAQGVGIGESLFNPDTSAILELKSSNKGLLVSRMTEIQRTSIINPATGLVVFQTDGTMGYYFNNGLPSLPSWILLGGSHIIGSGGSGQVTFWTDSANQSGSNNLFWDNGNGRLGIGTSDPSALLHISGTGQGEGNALFKGSSKYMLVEDPGDPPDSGAGTRFMWYPDKALFRAGCVTGNHWDKSNLGDFSAAWGLNTIASYYFATAWGDHASASGQASTAWGSSTTASNWGATAWGNNTSSTNFHSTAWGQNSNAGGARSTAFGTFTSATGDGCTAWGSSTSATGFNSTAWGSSTSATGITSTTCGRATIAPSFCETVMGSYNTNYVPASTGNWYYNDRLFVVGNGTEPNQRSNALTILKSGQTGILTDNPFGKFDVLHRQGGSSAVAGMSQQVVLGGPYDEGPNTNGVKLWIGDYNNDASAIVYPIYCEDENNLVDFWIKNRPAESGMPTMFFAGNYGIGVTNPDANLTIGNNINGLSLSGDSWISVGTSGNNTSAGIAMGSDATSNRNLVVNWNETGTYGLIQTAQASQPVVMQYAHTGKIGMGTNAPNTKVDVAGDLALRQNAFTAQPNPANNNNIDAGGYSFLRITSAGNFTITGVANGYDGKILTLLNSTAFNMTIANENANSANQHRIITNTGGSIATINQGSVTLQYSSPDNRWIVIAVRD